MSGGGLFCTFCFENETLNVAKLPEWADEYKFLCALFATPTDPALNALPLCDNCLHNFRQLSGLREQLIRVQGEIRELKRIFKDRILVSEDSAVVEYAINSITTAPRKNKIQREQFAQFQSARKFRHAVVKTLSNGNVSKRGAGGKKRQHDQSGDERPDGWINDEEDLAASAINDFDYEYFDNVSQDPDWTDGIPSSSSPSRSSPRRNATTTSPSKRPGRPPSSKKSKATPKTDKTPTTRKNYIRHQDLVVPEAALGAKSFVPRKQHFSDKQKSRPFKCSLCPRGFEARHLLFSHFAIHTGQENYSCEICKVGFRSRHSFKKHNQDTHGSGRPFKCVTCPEAFLRQSALDRHKCPVTTSRGKEGDDFKCEHCGKCLKNLRCLGKHVREYHGETERERQSCLFCSKDFSFRSLLLRHLKAAHAGKNLPVSATGPGFRCPVCQKDKREFATSIEFMTHWFIHGQCVTTKNKCKVCDVDFETRDFYYEHLQNAHGLTIEPRIACEICDLTLVNQTQYEFHLKLHSDTVPPKAEYLEVNCEHCQVLIRKKNLKRHLENNHWDLEGRTKVCPKSGCGKEFKTVAGWRDHLVGHRQAGGDPNEGDDRQRTECDICGRGFDTKFGFRIHYNQMHLDEDINILMRQVQDDSSRMEMEDEFQNPDQPVVTAGGDLWENSLRKKCFVCYKSYRVKTQLQRHLKLIHKNKKKTNPCRKTNRKRFRKMGGFKRPLQPHPPPPSIEDDDITILKVKPAVQKEILKKMTPPPQKAKDDEELIDI